MACSNILRTSTGAISIVNNQLTNIGGIEASGMDLAFNYLGPATGIGQFDVRLMATYLSNYTEITNNADGSETRNDLTGTITDQTFQRAFPEWRLNADFRWILDRWDGGVRFRWVDDLLQPSGEVLGSEFYTDVNLSFSMNPDREGFRFTVGANNVFDNEPAVCRNTCGSTNMSAVVHDLPGIVAYFKVSYLH